MRFHTSLDIKLSIFGENISLLKSMHPTQNILFMVKANGYGHGAISLVHYAHNELGINEFGCASLGEAIKLRDSLPKDKFDLFVFSDLNLQDEKYREMFVFKRIIPVISSLEDLNYFFSDPHFMNMPLVLKINTGMNRLGFNEHEIETVIALIKENKREEIYHLMSHFGCSSMPKSDKRNQNQLLSFKKIAESFKANNIKIRYASMANSGAIEQNMACSSNEFSHIRPGLMLYGPSSLLPKAKTQLSQLQQWQGKVISSLQTRIIRSFKVEAGERVGYGGTAVSDTGYIAIIPLGYGDGLNSSYRGVQVPVKGHFGTVFGRVNMDMCQIYFKQGSVDFKDLSSGQEVVVWDHNPASIDRLASETGLIPYELFCQLSPRVPRIYLS